MPWLDGLIDNRNASGLTTRLPLEQLREFAKLVEAGTREVTASCAGGVSISSLSSPSASGSTITSARSESFSRSLDFLHERAPASPCPGRADRRGCTKTSHAR